MIDEIGIIIVTYNPDEINFIFNLNKYIDSASFIVVIDNSEKPYINEKLSNYSNVKCINTYDNVGIAKAQNIGIKYLMSQENRINYLLFFDQDSYLTTLQINELIKSLNELKLKHRIALMAPGNNESKRYSFQKEVISSGSLISRNAIEDVGEMRDDFFIDFVDYEWCWRARSNKYEIVTDNSVKLSHQTDNPKRIFGKIISSPIRNYYFFRNSIYVMKHHLLVDSYVIFSFKMLKHLVFEVVFCGNKKKRIRYISHGIKDGILGNMGKL
ncbi:glycosyltransferase family 2 protein [Lactiplantibacillus plantarum]|uniref:glycosyltransferase family 2 protein n=1 Tax=Lactiplantibacillus plantarum TaxID=1590 RepID=UPI00107602D4|nr:glycosyltransferase family 2 protein [Lactiplantibacillus plantarum]TFZ26147.1 glycosyltransferase family 2 protein [Lactiplantibacillus plantarum]